MPGALLGVLIKDFPRLFLAFFGVLVSMLISSWVWLWGGHNDVAAYLTWIISFTIYMVLMYGLVFPKIKKHIICKHCGNEFDASKSLVCPKCFKTNAY